MKNYRFEQKTPGDTALETLYRNECVWKCVLSVRDVFCTVVGVYNTLSGSKSRGLNKAWPWKGNLPSLSLHFCLSHLLTNIWSYQATGMGVNTYILHPHHHLTHFWLTTAHCDVARKFNPTLWQKWIKNATEQISNSAIRVMEGVIIVQGSLSLSLSFCACDMSCEPWAGQVPAENTSPRLMVWGLGGQPVSQVDEIGCQLSRSQSVKVNLV